ncbi:MAG TPA: CHAT domain-containing tetratricopeptide repeat protein [Pyrinomonadaceae bacterium]|jgi:CHAT domain-containing protein/tetratricopeptide (TPR) repeat protein
MQQLNLSPIRFRYNLAVLAMMLFVTWAFGQTPSHIQELLPNQTFEREVTGAETHRYKFDFRADEFFQVRIEQKGVDVTLKLLDANGNVLAMMDSPNGKEGFEILTFVAEKSGSFILEVANSDAKVKKGSYTIKREASRTATEKDKRRVEVERVFVEGMTARNRKERELVVNKLKEALAGWEELQDNYLKELTAQQIKQLAPVTPEIYAIIVEINKELQNAQSLLMEGQKLAVKSGADSLSAREKLNQALALSRSVNARVKDKALSDKVRQSGESAEQSLNVLKILEFHSKGIEAEALNGVAQTYANLNEREQSIDFSKQALSIYQEIFSDKSFQNLSVGDFKGILLKPKLAFTSTLVSIGHDLDNYFGKSEEGLKYLTQAVESYHSLYQETQDQQFKLLEANTLTQIGLVYGRESKGNDKAIEFLIKSLKIYQSLPNQSENVARTFSSIASHQSLNYDFENALRTLDKALAIYRENNDKGGQSTILRQIGVIYWVLNNKTKVAEYANQNLSILQSPDFEENWKKKLNTNGFGIYEELYDALVKQNRLDNIAYSYRLLENYQKSLEYYEKALLIAPSLKDVRTVRLSTNAVAYTFAKLEKWDKAAEFYKQAFGLSRKQGVKEDIADDLKDVGWALLEGGRPSEALTYQNEALLIYQSISVNEGKAFSVSFSGLLNEISRSHYALGNKRLAIFYGKRAVNAMQGERQRLQNLDPVSQKGFLERKSKHYRGLVDWLIAEGRVAEAEQVLPIIKEDEYFDYQRRDPKVAGELLDRISLTDDEHNALKRFEELTSQIAALGKKYEALEKESKNFEVGKFPRQAHLDELNKELADARTAFNNFLEELVVKFRNPATRPTDLSVLGVPATRALLNQINQPRTVIISTIVGEDSLNLIVTTTEASHAHTIEIKAADLNKLVLKFRAAVKNPNIDPRIVGKELYDKLFPSDLQKELVNVKADTIVWSLDGTLRYAPLAALWDGKQYLVEKYANSVITLASRNKLKQSSSRRANWTVLGVGVSQGGTIKGADGTSLAFASLPSVPEELCNVVNDPRKRIFCTRRTSGRSGVLSGRNLADDEFTLESFKRNLGRYSVVHIASHFNLNVGSENDSFLLLGGTNEEERKLTMAAMRKELNMKFAGVELLTLSACNTAMSSSDTANGAEIESFGALAQNQGAKSVLATLWPIADSSTRDLMIAFYRDLAINPLIGKAAALKKAQLVLLQGKYKVGETPLWRRELKMELRGVAGNQLPQFNRDAKARYAHPYYWSPFILIGDWR